MCGPASLSITPGKRCTRFLSVFGPARNLQPHYNIAPTDSIDVIRLDKQRQRELVPMEVIASVVR